MRTAVDREGHYEIAGLTDGWYDVFAYLDGFDVSRIVGLRLSRGAWYELDFRLQLSAKLECVYVTEPPFGSVSGDVIDEEGFPLPFAVVDAVSARRQARWSHFVGYADADGRYSVNLPAGPYALTATYPGYASPARREDIVVGKMKAQRLTAHTAPLMAANAGMESLRTTTNCGRLGFVRPTAR